MILDTSFIIDVMKNDKDALRKLEQLEQANEPQHVTVITIFEIFSGLARSQQPEEEKRKIIDVLDGQIILPFNQIDAEKAGQIDGVLIKEGKTIDVPDSMIGGIALIKQEKVLTRNQKHFSRIKGLKVETY